MRIARFLSEKVHVEDPVLLEKLTEIAQIRSLKKGDHTIRIGEMQTKLYLLMQGMMRCYFMDGTNQEVTDCFVVTPGYPVMTAIFSMPSLITAQAVVPTELLELPLDPVMTMMEEHPELLWVYNGMLQKALFLHWQIKTSRFTHDALERYLWFQSTWPEVERQANGRHIASFLGMAPETLSRVRRLAQNRAEVKSLMHDPYSAWDSGKIREMLNQGVRQDGIRREV